MNYKLCNVCGKELRRKHPGCNAKAERAKPPADSGQLHRTMLGLTPRQVLVAYGKADPLSKGIANMGQPARDAILRRMVTQREKQR